MKNFHSRFAILVSEIKKVPKSKIKRIAIETKIENKLIFNSAQGSNKKMPKNKTSSFRDGSGESNNVVVDRSKSL